MKKFIVCGYSKSGKTTLIKRILASTDKKVYGFFTEKFPDRLTEDGLCPVYIYPILEEPIFDVDHLIGLGGEGTHYTNVEVFNKCGIEYISCKDKDSLLLIDELGFLEDKAEEFQKRIFEILKSDICAVIAMKQKMQFSFMQKLKALTKEGSIEFIDLSEENRDEVFEYIKSSFE